jgi:hypothetical protein
MSDMENDSPTEDVLAWMSIEDQAESTTAAQHLGIALKHRSRCSLQSPKLKASPLSTNNTSFTLYHHSEDQLPSQQAYNQSSSHERKYQVTAIPNAPLKLRVS